MHGGLPPLAPLVTFAAAAETGSFARAAEKLCVTPAAVSKGVKTLEADLGAALFLRRPQKVVLTEAGRHYYQQISGALGVIDRASAELRNRRVRRPLTLCAFPSLVMRWLLPRWSRLQAAHPDIDVNFATTLGHYDLHRDPIDAALLTEERDFQNCNAEYLFTIDCFPVCSPALCDGRPPLAEPGALAGQTLLHAQTRRLDWRNWLSRAGLDDLRPAQELTLESSSVAYQAAIEGLGIAIGLGDLVQQDLERGALCAPFGTGLSLPLRMYLVRAPHARRDPALPRLADWIRTTRSL